MERIREVLAAQERYWRCYGGPSEEDHSLNDMNRDLIEAMNGHYGQVSLNLFNHRTNVEVSNRLLCYDIKALGKMLKKIGLLILTDQVWGRVTANREKRRATWVYQDEFHQITAKGLCRSVGAAV